MCLTEHMRHTIYFIWSKSLNFQKRQKSLGQVTKAMKEMSQIWKSKKDSRKELQFEWWPRGKSKSDVLWIPAEKLGDGKGNSVMAHPSHLPPMEDQCSEPPLLLQGRTTSETRIEEQKAGMPGSTQPLSGNADTQNPPRNQEPRERPKVWSAEVMKLQKEEGPGLCQRLVYAPK